MFWLGPFRLRRQSRNIVFETIIKTQNFLVVIFVLKEFMWSGPFRLRRQSRNIVFETIIKTQNSLVVIFVLKEFMYSGNYIIYSQEAVTSDINLHLLMARIMPLQQMIDDKNTFPFSKSIFPVLTPANFVCRAFGDFLISNKICKKVTNHLHLSNVDDDRTFV